MVQATLPLLDADLARNADFIGGFERQRQLYVNEWRMDALFVAASDKSPFNLGPAHIYGDHGACLHPDLRVTDGWVAGCWAEKETYALCPNPNPCPLVPLPSPPVRTGVKNVQACHNFVLRYVNNNGADVVVSQQSTVIRSGYPHFVLRYVNNNEAEVVMSQQSTVISSGDPPPPNATIGVRPRALPLLLDGHPLGPCDHGPGSAEPAGRLRGLTQACTCLGRHLRRASASLWTAR